LLLLLLSLVLLVVALKATGKEGSFSSGDGNAAVVRGTEGDPFVQLHSHRLPERASRRRGSLVANRSQNLRPFSTPASPSTTAEEDVALVVVVVVVVDFAATTVMIVLAVKRRRRWRR
jgi:hypothetical protein